MLALEFEINGDKQLSRTFSRFADDVQDLSEPFADVLDFMEDATETQFATEGAKGGTPWEPLTPGYAAYKARVRGGMPLLVFDARMINSLTAKGSEGAVREIKPLEIRFGTSIKSPGGYPYPVAHQEGRGLMPRRPVIEFNEDERREMTRIIQRFLVARATSLGLRGAY